MSSDSGMDPGSAAPPAATRSNPSTPRTGSGRALAGLAVILVLAATAGAVWWARAVQEPRFARLEGRLDAIDRSATGLAGEFRSALESTSAVREAQSVAKADITRLAQALNDLQATVQAELSAPPARDVTLSEIEILLHAANERLVLAGDVETALAALRAADARLLAANEPGVLPLREQITRDIAALETVPQSDVAGLALYLAEMHDRVETLPTKPLADPMPAASGAPPSAAQPGWKAVLAAVWRDLVSLVDIKDAELPDAALFDPERRYFLRENLRLELAAARYAALRRDTANLRASLRAIEQQLERYYDREDPGVATLRARLGEAATLDLAPPLPDVSASLELVRAQRAAPAVEPMDARGSL